MRQVSLTPPRNSMESSPKFEGRVLEEFDRGSIGAAWPTTCEEEETCIACDCRYFCDRSLADNRVAAGENEGGDDDRSGVRTTAAGEAKAGAAF